MKKNTFLVLLLFLCISCNNETKQQKEFQNQQTKQEQQKTKESKIDEETKLKKLNLNGIFSNDISEAENGTGFNSFKWYIFSNIVVNTEFRKIPIPLTDIERLEEKIRAEKLIVEKYKQAALEEPVLEIDKKGIEVANNLLEQFKKANEVLEYYKNGEYKKDDYAKGEKLLREYEKLVLKQEKLEYEYEVIITEMVKERESLNLSKLEKEGRPVEKAMLSYLYAIRDFDTTLSKGYETGFDAKIIDKKTVDTLKENYKIVKEKLSELKKINKKDIEKEKMSVPYSQILENSENINNGIEKILERLDENREIVPELVSRMNSYATYRAKTIKIYNNAGK